MIYTKLTTIWRQEWKLVAMIDLVGKEVEEWEACISILSLSHLRIKDDEDELIWSKNHVRGIYTPKVGYHALSAIDGV